MTSGNARWLGFFYCIAIAGIAEVVAPYLPIGRVMCALLLGLLVGQTLGIPDAAKMGIHFAEKQVLSWAVILMGAGLRIHHMTALGWQAIAMVLCSVLVSLWGAKILGRRMGLSANFSLLLGIGNGICGGSAIAGAAPLLRAKENEVATGIAAVNLVGTLAMFLLPATALWSFVSDVHIGYLAGGTLQAVGHVTAAGYAVSDQAGQLATTIKLGRVFCMAPLFLLISFWRPGANGKKKWALPYFVPGFLLMMCMANAGFLPTWSVGGLQELTSFLLSVAMAAIGWKIQWNDFKSSGMQALAVVSILWLSQVFIVTAWLFAL